MGLIHTPRTLVRIAKGLWDGRNLKKGSEAFTRSMGPENPHIYRTRLGLIDIDYLGHMNNAAYLSHAELARWELTANNGMLKSMVRSNTNFIVTSSAVRYRQEIRPLFRPFQIESFVAGLTDRYIYMVQNFRHAEDNTSEDVSGGGGERIRAQVVIQAVARNRKGILNPADFLADTVGFDREKVDSLLLVKNDGKEDDTSIVSFENVIDRYEVLQDTLKDATTADDEQIK